MRYIYVIDTYSTCEQDKSGLLKITGQRCVGCFSSLKKAKKAIENNLGDIYECGSYPFAQIERVGLDGVYQQDTDSRIWYEWVGDIESGEYCEFPVPKYLENFDICGIG